MTRTHKEFTTGREAVYGWYPPQYDMYLNPRNQRGYEKECLFRHSQSQYTGKRLVDSPMSPSLSVQGSGMQPGRTSSASRPPSGKPRPHVTRPKTTGQINRVNTMTPSKGIPTPNFQYRPPGYRPFAPSPEMGLSAPSPQFGVTPDGKMAVTPTKRQGFTPQATPIFTPNPPKELESTATPHVHFKSAMEFYTPRGYTAQKERDIKQAAGQHPFVEENFYDPISSPEVHVSTPEGMRDVLSPASQTSVHSVSRPRIQSATIRREKSATPKRPVKSAGAVRTRPATVSPEDPEIVRICSTMEVEVKTPTPTLHVQTTPSELTPQATPIVQERCDTPDYEDLLDTYGWRVEVHGDPLGIKHVPSRLPYTVKCDNPVIPPNPPKAHMMNYETYFYNTIPRRRATYEVHKEWVSEVLLEKRKESQKRTGQVYRQKNYAFIY